MSVTKFADTNIIVYAVGKDSEHRAIARQIIADGVIVSTQVINETISVLSRKQHASLAAAHEVAESLLDLCDALPVDVQTIRKAIDLAKRYQFSHWDWHCCINRFASKFPFTPNHRADLGYSHRDRFTQLGKPI